MLDVGLLNQYFVHNYQLINQYNIRGTDMNREVLKDILLSQEKREFLQGKIIKRELEKKVLHFDANSFIIIISGIRRCGKSTLLHQIRKPDSYYVNFDDERFLNFKVNDFQKMYEILIELFGKKDKFYFDEIQNIEGWERFVRRLHNQGKRIFITGSNASMLSQEMGTHLTGRNIRIELYPFSFREFLRYQDKEVENNSNLVSTQKAELKRLFLSYMKLGGFPEFLNTGKIEYLQNLYENILFRDIIARYNIRSQKALQATALFAASNIGKQISFNQLKKMTGLTSGTTIKNFFQYLENSYLTFLLPRFNYSLKSQIYSNKKVYLIDPKLSQVIGFRFSEDRGRILENLVFLHLKRNFEELFFHKEKYECDFIVKKDLNIKKAIQVTWQLTDHNKKRELNGLLEALNKYNLNQGLLLTFDQENIIKIDNKKIILMPVWKWMLEA